MRVLARIIFGVAFIFSLSVIVMAIFFKSVVAPDSLNAIAASLAVITAIFSSYGALKIVENEEDSRRPRVTIEPDLFSNAWAAQVSIRNVGLQDANSVSFHFDPSVRSDCKLVKEIEKRSISGLSPGEVLKIIICSTVDLFNNEPLIYTGSIEFSGPHGKRYTESFLLDLEKYKNSPVHLDEYHSAAEKIQKIPEEVAKIATELKNLTNQIKEKKSEE